jgi:hypothetical protein
MEAGRQQTVHMCYYCCLSRQGQKKPIHNINQGRNTGGAHSWFAGVCPVCSRILFAWLFFYNYLGSIYGISVIFFGQRGGHGPPWPPWSSASGHILIIMAWFGFSQ